MTLSLDMMRRWLVTSPGSTDDPDQFPLLPGQMLVTGKAPIWLTSIATSSSGRERRQSRWSYPKWRFKIKYEVIRDRPSQPELERMFAFFCLHQGQRSPFSFFDPYDNRVTNQTIGVGNGVVRVFQLTRSLGVTGLSFVEPVRRVLSATVSVNGAEVSGWSVDSSGAVTLASAPAAGAVVTWSGQFMFLCRFTMDEMDPEQMTKDLWSLDGVELMSVKR